MSYRAVNLPDVLYTLYVLGTLIREFESGAQVLFGIVYDNTLFVHFDLIDCKVSFLHIEIMFE